MHAYFVYYIILFCDAFYIMIERCKMGVVYRVVLTVALMPKNTMSLFTVVPPLMSSRSRVRVEVVVQNYTHAVEGRYVGGELTATTTRRRQGSSVSLKYMMEREGMERFVENARETYPAFLP